MTSTGTTSETGSTPPAGTAAAMRASDADRLATVQAIQDAVARGLLTPDEGGERMAAAFAAVHLPDLVPLTADLPAAPARTAPGWRTLATMTAEQVRSSLHSPATGRLTPARVAVALGIALLLVLLVAALVGDLLPDGGPGGGGAGRGVGRG